MQQSGARLTRRQTLTGGFALAAGGALAAKFGRPATVRTAAHAALAEQATPVVSGDRAADVVAIARDSMTKYDLRAVILRVVVDGEELVTTAMGESMTGV